MQAISVTQLVAVSPATERIHLVLPCPRAAGLRRVVLHVYVCHARSPCIASCVASSAAQPSPQRSCAGPATVPPLRPLARRDTARMRRSYQCAVLLRHLPYHPRSDPLTSVT